MRIAALPQIDCDDVVRRARRRGRRRRCRQQRADGAADAAGVAREAACKDQPRRKRVQIIHKLSTAIRTSSPSPLPLLTVQLQLPRILYLPCFLDTIIAFFKDELIDAKSDEELSRDAWFSFEDAPLKWFRLLSLIVDTPF